MRQGKILILGLWANLIIYSLSVELLVILQMSHLASFDTKSEYSDKTVSPHEESSDWKWFYFICRHPIGNLVAFEQSC